jgi:NitT/TauT family transport system substrate-binding protein
VTSASFAVQHPALVDRFRSAVLAAEALADREPNLVRSIFPTYMKVSRQVAFRMGLAYYPSSGSIAPIVREERLMKTMGMLPAGFDLQRYVLH